MRDHLGLLKVSQVGRLVLGFLTILDAISHHNHGVARAGLSNPWPPEVYNTPMSVYFGYVVEEAEQDLADYAECRHNLRHPDTSPLADHWECERLYVPDRVSLVWSFLRAIQTSG